MKDMSSHERLVKNKGKRQSSETASQSSDSDKEIVPVINQEVMSDSSDEEEVSHPKCKRRKHHHHHHHHHKRRHKERDNGRERQDESREERFTENHSSRHQHSSHRRHGEEHVRSRAEEEERYSRSSRHRHRDESGDRVRHHRKRDGEDRHRRYDTSRTRRSSMERENRDQAIVHREERGNFSGRRARNGDQSTFQPNRPIKKERSSEEKQFEWGKPSEMTEIKPLPPEEREKPNFEVSGKLAQDTNTFNGVVLKYSEPSEARKPKRRWRFYPFKGDQGLPTLYLHRQSCYLIGRDRKVADIPVDHPSCSKQHAALQYRLVPYTRDDGSTGRRVRPYLIDLDSANGTYVNNKKIEGKKYVELLEKDVVKFGYSSREYVLLHEESKDDALDDDVTGAQT